MKIVLWALQSPINIGMIIRTAEVYRVPVAIFDQHAVLAQPTARATISDFACGAFERSPPRVLADPKALRAALRGRWIASSAAPDATPIQQMVLKPTDCVLVGNEYDGLPSEVVTACAARLLIPMPEGVLRKPISRDPIDPSRRTGVANDGAPNLNVAVAASIIMFSANASSLAQHGSGSGAQAARRG